MKKITSKIALLLIFGLVSFNINAQTTYYEDFRYENEARGFTVQKVSLGGQAADQVGKRVNDVVDAGDSDPVFDESLRPANRIPSGVTRQQRSIAFTNTSGSPADTNFEIEAWALMTNQDLSSTNNPKVSFWTQQRYVKGSGATLTIWVSENYTHGNAISSATWTNETENIIGKIATADVAPQTFVFGSLNLNAYKSASVTVAFKINTDNSAYVKDVSQHGTFYISDVKFEAARETVADGEFSALNTSASGQTGVFNTPTASIDEANFSNTSKWADIFTSQSSVPRLANGVLIPINEGYKFEVADKYDPIAITEIKYQLANATSNKGNNEAGEPTASKWVMQGSTDDTNWDDLNTPLGMFSSNSGTTPYTLALNTKKAYRYYRFVLAEAWRPNQTFTSLQQLNFTVDNKVLSVKNTIINDTFSVYPNPTNSFINISDKNNTIKNVKLMDFTGKLIYNNNNINTINVANFSKGLYILRVETKQGGIASKKVIIN